MADNTYKYNSMRTVVIGVTIAATIILFKCQSNEKLERDSSIVEMPSKNNLNTDSSMVDTSNCALLDLMLNQPCVLTTSRLTTKSLEGIEIHIPPEIPGVNCTMFSLLDKEVILRSGEIDIQTASNIKLQKAEPIRTFYLTSYKHSNGMKTIELSYYPAGSKYKLVVSVDQGKALIKDFFCYSI